MSGPDAGLIAILAFWAGMVCGVILSAWLCKRTAAGSESMLQPRTFREGVNPPAVGPRPAPPPMPRPCNGLTRAASDVLAERRRQIEHEYWTPEHDDEHCDGSLAAAAGCYALHAASQSRELNQHWRDRFAKAARELWPWDVEDFKPKDARRDLVRASALGLAEIERTDRQGGEPYVDGPSLDDINAARDLLRLGPLKEAR